MTELPLANDLPRSRSSPAERRRAWRDRNRLAVVDALLDLIDEGNSRPGAHEIAERSGVSRRSVFRYFDDMEDLHRMAIERQEDRVRHLLRIHSFGRGTLEERIDALARQRVCTYEAIRPIARVARTMAASHQIIRDRLDVSRAYYADQVTHQFEPEFAQMDETRQLEILAAAQALCAFESYDFLVGRGVTSEQYGSILRRSLALLLAPC